MTTTKPEVVRVTDDTTKAELAECIGHLNHLAKREMPRVGTAEHPTPWDLSHRKMDRLLDDLAKAPA